MTPLNSLCKFSILFTFSVLVALGNPLSGQEIASQRETSAARPDPALNEAVRHNIEDWIHQGLGIPDDWSHHYLVFSNARH